ncbi:MAG: hypothetical protein QM754_10595 [Tepidisphaeraceae bacterium]
MMAPRDQLTRWRTILDVPLPGNPPPTDALQNASGRKFLVAAAAFAARADAKKPDAAAEAADSADSADDKNVSNAESAASAAAFVLPPLRPLPVRRPAVEGATVADAVWLAYLHTRAGSRDAVDWMRSFLLTLSPTALVFTADDNPEPWWQNEMVILHAVHSFALRSGDASLIEQSLACTDFHLREIQPDHATNEPWAIHAYASHADGNVTAETLWHAGHIQHGGDLGPVARHLARDARDALATFLQA